MGTGLKPQLGKLESKMAHVALRPLVVAVAGLVLALSSACGSTPDAAPADGDSGEGAAGGASGASGGPASGGGSAGSGGTTMSLGGGGGSGAGGSGAGGSGAGGSSAGAAGSSGSGGSGPVSTFKIEINYMFDTMGAFTPERRVVLEAAARTWEDLILSEFEDVPAGTTVRTRHPEHPAEDGMNFPAPDTIDDLVAFVAFAEIDGLGTSRAKASLSFAGGVADPVLLQQLTARYEENPFQPWVGNVSFDLAETWFYDPTPNTDDDLPPQQSDFMTTSLHELGHLLGIGTSAAWDSLVVDNQFTGPRAVALNGGPVPVSADLSHVDAVLLQKVDLMMAGTADGERLLPGALDLAILEDLGYTVRH
jgi:hypothetical protein